MNTSDRIMRAYERALKRLPGSREKQEEYRDYIRRSLRDVLAAQPDAGEGELRTLLGDPEAVRESFIRSLSDEELALGRREAGKAQVRRLLLLLPLCAVLIGFAVLFVCTYFFPQMTVCIARPADPAEERYLEYPTVVTSASIFGVSASSALRAREFTDKVFFVMQRFDQQYPGQRHIRCSAASEDGNTVIRWTGTGTTPDGVTEEVDEELIFPFRFRLQRDNALRGQAAERASQSQATKRESLTATS